MSEREDVHPAVKYAIDRITIAMVMLDRADLELEAEGLREVLDQLTGFCASHMRLIGAGGGGWPYRGDQP